MARAIGCNSQIESASVHQSVSQKVERDVTISVRVVQRLIDAIEQAGVPRAEIMRAVGSHAAQIDEADARISSREVERICELAIELTSDPALGLHWSAGLTERTFAPVSQVLSYAGSLRKSLALLSEYEGLFCDQAFFALTEEHELATIRLFPGWVFSSARMAGFAAEMAIGGFLIVIRLFCPRDSVVRVSLGFPAPAHHEEYARAFGAAVAFDQPFTGVVFDRRVLDQASPHTDQDIYTAMQTVAERRLLQVSKNAPYALRVRQLLKDRASERCNMASVARALGMSTRSLRRQLSAEGTSYREIEYSALAAVARQLLCEKLLSIQETAYAMGFSDAATFHRALKQWSGMTPTELRESAG